VVQGPDTGEYAQAADRWHVGFYDLSGSQGMLGQVEGRTADDAAYWLAGATPAWRDAMQVVAIDMCTIFASAVRRMPSSTWLAHPGQESVALRFGFRPGSPIGRPGPAALRAGPRRRGGRRPPDPVQVLANELRAMRQVVPGLAGD
jgi:hypothetical protein